MYLMTVRDANGNFAFREELLSGKLWNFPYGTTTQIPVNLGGGADESEVYLVDMADVVIGDATSIIIDASTEAAYHDGANVVAAFSQDQTVVRAIVQHDIGMRHDASVAVLAQVKWTP
jgi:HK97 family phage major capsid protein